MTRNRMKTMLYEFNVGVKEPVTLFVFSDLHITEKMDTEVLTSLYHRAKRCKPDAIIFLGDMVDTIEFLDVEKNYKLLKNFLDMMAEIAPFYIITGNHDIRSIPGKRKRRMFVKEPKEFWKDITKNPRIEILKNASVKTDKFFLAGVEQGPACYSLDTESSVSTLQKHILVSEKAEMMEVALKKFLKKVKTPRNVAKPRILLVHSARFLTERNLGGLVKDYDVILSGHLHNMAMSEKVFRKMMAVWGLGLKNGHLVCPPVTAFTDPKKQRHYTRYCAVVKIK
ncbi:metallophosphoesterase family protein [Candidatus Saccharibacteria bacterium]|nr:metallophosphoesterase family protein [Candidatus Saccharibacteria bacterium]